jgi:hypothetical protein
MNRPSEVLLRKQQGNIGKIDCDIENTPAWGDGKRFIRLSNLLEHMEVEKTTTIRADEAARFMKCSENEAYNYLDESTKFEKISDSSFELVGLPFTKGRVSILLRNMAKQNKSRVFLGEAAKILKTTSTNAYQHINKSGLFEKTNIRGCYKLKGAKIEEKPEIKEEVKEEITDKSLNTTRISAKIKVKPILEYMASIGLQKIRIGNAARLLHTTSSDASYQMIYSGMFEKTGVKGMYQLKGEKPEPKSEPVKEEVETPIEETKPVKVEKKPQFARVKKRRKVDLVVEYMLSRNLDEIKYTQAADIMGCSIQSAHIKLSRDVRFSKVQGFGRSTKGMFNLIDKTFHPSPKETVEPPITTVTQTKHPYPLKSDSKASKIARYMKSKNLTEINVVEAGAFLNIDCNRAHACLNQSSLFTLLGMGIFKRTQIEPSIEIKEPVKKEIILPTTPQISTSDLDKYEHSIIPVKEQLEPENKEGYIEEEMDSDEMPKPLIKKVKVAYFCPHCGNEVIIGSTEEHRQKILQGLEKAKEIGSIMGRPKIEFDEKKMIVLRRLRLTTRKIVEKMGLKPSKCCREVKRLEDEGRI